MNIVEIVNNEILHDMPFQSLSFDFETGSAMLNFLQFDDLKSDYVCLSWKLCGIFSFESKFPEKYVFEEAECFSQFCRQTEAGFVLDLELTDSERNFWFLSLGFTSLKTEGGLSEEARADRAAYLQENEG